MSVLRQTIERETARFAETIVRTVRAASINELISIAEAMPANGRAPTLRRRSGQRPSARALAIDDTRTLDAIIGLLRKHPGGLRAEQLRTTLGLDKRNMPKALAKGLASGVVTKSGQRRATVYSLGSGASAASPQKAAANQVARKKSPGSNASDMKMNAAREWGTRTKAAMEKSIVSFVRASGPEGATKSEWLQSIGLWPPGDSVPLAAIRKAATTWAIVEMTGTIRSTAVTRGGRDDGDCVYLLAEKVQGQPKSLPADSAS